MRNFKTFKTFKFHRKVGKSMGISELPNFVKVVVESQMLNRLFTPVPQPGYQMRRLYRKYFLRYHFFVFIGI